VGINLGDGEFGDLEDPSPPLHQPPFSLNSTSTNQILACATLKPSLDSALCAHLDDEGDGEGDEEDGLPDGAGGRSPQDLVEELIRQEAQVCLLPSSPDTFINDDNIFGKGNSRPAHQD